MKVAVDALPLLGRTGVSNYLSGLFSALPAIDPAVSYRLYFRTGPRPAKLPELPEFPSVSCRRVLLPNRFLESLWTFRSMEVPFSGPLFGRPDVFFSTIYFTPVLDCPVVSVFYDMTSFLIPEYSGLRTDLKVRLDNLVKRSRYIISISENSRRDLCEYFGAEPSRVFAVPLACGTAFRPMSPDEAASALSRYALEPGYILYVGNMGPHKNVSALLRAYARLRAEKRTDAKLVLCGSVKWGGEALKLAGELGLSDSAIFLDYAPAADLPALYAGSAVFVYVSLYEGFGLPVLEAMACGRPVVTSSVSSLPEVAGGAAVLVDPRNEEEIAGAIGKVLTDEALSRRLSEASLRRAAEFSWEKTAAATLDVLKKAAACGRGSAA